MDKTTFTVGEDKKTLIVERVFQAPKHKLWAAYSQPDLIAKWWAPQGWQTEVKHMDFTDGGYWHYGMKCVDPEQTDWFGKYSWGRATYSAINPEDSFEYEDAFCDETGAITEGMPVSRTKIEFTEQAGATRMYSLTTYDSPEALAQVLEMGMKEGFAQALDHLEDVVTE